MKAMLFDFDGVVADTMKLHADSWVLAFQKYKMNLRHEVVYENEGAPFSSIIRTLFQSCGSKYQELLAGKIIKTKETIFKGYDHSNRIYPGIFDILSLVEKNGRGKGLVTGTSANNLQRTIPQDLLSRFDIVVTADMVSKGKPNPDPYLKAINFLNLDPKECLVIENAPLGILAAKRAGCKCVAICTTLTSKHLNLADMIVKDHYELLVNLPRFF